jgi:hypothetical protein
LKSVFEEFKKQEWFIGLKNSDELDYLKSGIIQAAVILINTMASRTFIIETDCNESVTEARRKLYHQLKVCSRQCSGLSLA